MKKKELKYIHYLSIGGIERPLQLKLITINKFFIKWNKLISKYKDNPNSSIYTLKLNDLLNDVVYDSLFKEGYFFFKKPFRSRKHMIRSLLTEEYEAYSNFIADRILNEKKQTKKKQK